MCHAKQTCFEQLKNLNYAFKLFILQEFIKKKKKMFVSS